MIETPFERALHWIWRAEGIDADHPADHGGRTRYGISQAAHPDVDVSTLTAERAAQIYKREYWDAAGCDRLPMIFGIALFDGAVNHGSGTATRMLQGALGVSQDGIVGPVTAAHARAERPPFGCIRQYLVRRALYYRRLVQSDSTQAVFLEGWFARLFRLEQYLFLELED